MKRTTVLVLALGGAVTVSALALLHRGNSTVGGSTPEQSFRTPPPTTVAVGVDQLMKDPEKYPGEFVVEGVVSASAPGLVSLIDAGEVEACGVTTCAELVLPIEWSGYPPAVKQQVKLRGRISETAKGMVFVASSLEAAAPITAGAAQMKVDNK